MDLSDVAEPILDSTRTARPHGFACDTCRRRRVKCDGNQPCNRCLKSSVACTYGSATSRTSTVAYVRHLEQQIAELQARLRERWPEETTSQSSQLTSSQEGGTQQNVDMFIGPGDDYVYREPFDSSNMFIGRFGGLNVLRAVGDMAQRTPANAQTVPEGLELLRALEKSNFSLTPKTPDRFHAMLPSQVQAQGLIQNAMRTGLICHDCLDREELPRRLNRLYEIDPEDYDRGDKKFLILTYALLALGRRGEPLTQADVVDESQEKVRIKGYFLASHEMLNVTDSHDLDSIRALICQARYLFSISMLSKAYSLMCTGITAALRMGLHVSGPAIARAFTPDEMFQRRRVFAVLYMMDTYMSSMLGIPKTLRDVDDEQTLGLRNEDLVDEGRTFISQNPTIPAVETLYGEKLNIITAKLLEVRDPVKKQDAHLSDKPYEENADITAIYEAELEKWHQDLSDIPRDMLDSRGLEAQLMLRLWHSAMQLTLYRPFLHHLAQDRQDPDFNIRGYEYGSACVRAAMQTVWIIEAFQTNGFLHDAYWLITYTLGFVSNILVFFVTHCPQRATIEESIAAAQKARDMLGWLARYNLSARRCFILVSQLLESVENVHPDS